MRQVQTAAKTTEVDMTAPCADYCAGSGLFLGGGKTKAGLYWVAEGCVRSRWLGSLVLGPRGRNVGGKLCSGEARRLFIWPRHSVGDFRLFFNVSLPVRWPSRRSDTRRLLRLATPQTLGTLGRVSTVRWHARSTDLIAFPLGRVRLKKQLRF